MEAAATDLAGLLDRQRRYARLANEKDALETRLDQVKVEMQLLEEPILEGMVSIEQPRTHIEGRTIHIHRQLWARATDKEAAANVLHEVGLADEYVSETFNTNKISALFREWDRAEDDGVLTPQDAAMRTRLLDVFEVAEKFSLRANK